METMCMKRQRKNKKNIMNLSHAEYANNILIFLSFLRK